LSTDKCTVAGCVALEADFAPARRTKPALDGRNPFRAGGLRGWGNRDPNLQGSDRSLSPCEYRGEQGRPSKVTRASPLPACYNLPTGLSTWGLCITRL
jgi:hypothetical protein